MREKSTILYVPQDGSFVLKCDICGSAQPIEFDGDDEHGPPYRSIREVPECNARTTRLERIRAWFMVHVGSIFRVMYLICVTAVWAAGIGYESTEACFMVHIVAGIICCACLDEAKRVEHIYPEEMTAVLFMWVHWMLLVTGSCVILGEMP